MTILFDLDGTISDSFLGITKCVQYALRTQGIEVEDLHELTDFIGPPLSLSFRKRYGFDDETIAFLVKKYRERFDKIGVFENELYPGVKEALASLQDRGYALVLASSKPEDACRIILKHHGILSYFTEVVGATLDSRISSKKEVLEEVLRRMDIQNPKECILIGDTIYDVEGAKDIGMDCIGVSYGFGRVEELERAGAYCICKDLEEVVRSIERYQVI